MSIRKVLGVSLDISLMEFRDYASKIHLVLTLLVAGTKRLENKYQLY